MVFKSSANSRRLSIGQQLAAIEAGMPNGEAVRILEREDGELVFHERTSVHSAVKDILNGQAGVVAEGLPSGRPSLDSSDSSEPTGWASLFHARLWAAFTTVGESLRQKLANI